MSNRQSRLLVIYPTSASYLAKKGVKQRVESKWGVVAELFDKCVIALPASSSELRVSNARAFSLPADKVIRFLSLPILLTYGLVVFRPTVIRVYDFVWTSLVCPWAKLAGVPLVTSLHGHWDRGLAQIQGNPFKRWAYPFLEKMAVRCSALVICTSRSLCHHARQIGALRVEHVPTWGVDMASVGLRTHRRASADGLRQILMVGRVARQKNIELAVRALQILRERRGINAGLIVVGPLDDVKYLSELRTTVASLGMADYVHLAGGLTNDKVLGLYLAADCLLMTSVMEGTPHPVLESLASNCPVVSSAVGDVRELIEDGKNGYVFDLDSSDPGHVAELIEAAFALGTLPDYCGRDRIAATYSAQASAAKERDVLQTCIK